MDEVFGTMSNDVQNISVDIIRLVHIYGIHNLTSSGFIFAFNNHFPQTLLHSEPFRVKSDFLVIAWFQGYPGVVGKGARAVLQAC